jgi:thermostable 8-oxoguanine DNA glycosylase
MMNTMTYTNEQQAWQTLHQFIRNLPDQNDECLPGVKWGDYNQLYTPAFWKMQYISYMQMGENENIYKLGSNILEEVVVCLLGGFGMPSEIGLAAYDRLKEEGLISPFAPFSDIYNALRRPFMLGDGRKVHYRFYNQKSKYLYGLLNRTDLNKIPLHDDIQLRDWLLSVKGIGLKTASWITRNWLDSNNVAILDIHIIRAGLLAGFYTQDTDNLSKHYFKLERQYLAFCKALEVSAAIMDAIIWDFMKKTNKLALNALRKTN